jgi:hypothetical protein
LFYETMIEESMKRLQTITFTLLLFLLVSCAQATVKAPAPTQAGSATQEGYPAPGSAQEATSYPVPEIEETFVEPTRDPGQAVVRGKLLLQGKPFTDGQVYLSDVIKGDQGTELVVGFDRTSIVRGELDKQGNFTIVNVPPGRYGVVLDMVSNAYLLMAPGKEESFIIDVTSGQDLDLGTMDYPNLPKGD